MQFIDLQTQFRYLEDDIRNAIDSVLKHGRFIMGPEVFELEEQLAERVGVKHAITCASGTDALLMVLMACGLPGSAVALPNNAGIIWQCGSMPIHNTLPVRRLASVRRSPKFTDILASSTWSRRGG